MCNIYTYSQTQSYKRTVFHEFFALTTVNVTVVLTVHRHNIEKLRMKTFLHVVLEWIVLRDAVGAVVVQLAICGVREHGGGAILTTLSYCRCCRICNLFRYCGCRR